MATMVLFHICPNEHVVNVRNWKMMMMMMMLKRADVVVHALMVEQFVEVEDILVIRGQEDPMTRKMSMIDHEIV